MDFDILNMLEGMASIGHAPDDGCSMFGVGYEDAFKRLKETYFLNLFQRGGSAEKYVVGPFGSGKTHFLRHLSEIARGLGCVTVEISLTKDIDFTKSIIVYKEMARDVRCPGSKEHGIRSLLTSCIEKIREKAPDNSTAELVVGGWISGLDKFDFELDSFGRIAKKAFEAYIGHDDDTFEMACRWLGGEVDDRGLAKGLGLSPVSKSEQNLFAKRATLSLFQLIRHSGFTGTVVCFDEAEQGLTVDKKKTERIHSMLQAGINAVADLKRGSALLVYAFTPDLVAKMETFAALQQRIISPPGFDFFDGNTRAPLIDLTKRQDPEKELKAIGESLVDFVYRYLEQEISVPKDEVLKKVDEIAEDIASTDITSSNRRTMVKTVCSLLLKVHESGKLEVAATDHNVTDEDEV